MSSSHLRARAFACFILLAGGACSSSGGASKDASGSGGSPAGSGGSSGGSGGSASGGGGGGSGGGVGSGGSGGVGAGGADGGGAGAGGTRQDGGATDAATETGSDAAVAFMLISPAYTEGTAIPPPYTCAGANMSPQLDWTAGPAATLSYAIIFHDMSNGLTHWVLWDIPAATRSLPASLAGDYMLATPANARQASIRTHQYTGPCPGGALHTYVMDLYALDVAVLPGLTMASTANQAATQVTMHMLAKATLTGTSNARMP